MRILLQINPFKNSILNNLFLLFTVLATFSSTLSAQGPYVPAADVSGQYMVDQCGSVKIKFKYIDVGYYGITKLDFYYKKADGTFVMFAQADDGNGYNQDWSDYWAGSSIGAFTFQGYSTFVNSVAIGYRNNNGNYHYQDFIWSNIPAEAYVNGTIVIATEGTYSNGSSWDETDNSSKVVIVLPTLAPPTNLVAGNGIDCNKITLEIGRAHV